MRNPRLFIAERKLRFGEGLCLVDEYGDVVPGQISVDINQCADEAPTVTVKFLMLDSGVPLCDPVDPVLARINELVTLAKDEIAVMTRDAKQRLGLLAA